MNSNELAELLKAVEEAMRQACSSPIHANPVVPPHYILQHSATPVSYSDRDEPIETKDLDTKIAVTNIMLGWLSKVVDKPTKDIMFTLYDLSADARESLLKRNGTWSSRKVTYPGTDIKLKALASRYQDYQLYRKHVRELEEKCRAQTGFDMWTAPGQKWQRNHGNMPNQYDEEYNYIKVTFSLDTKDKETTFSQHEIETMLTEEFLLGGSDER